MGDAYKGLTIRIGADTTELTKAMRSANSAVSTTQKQLRQLQQAAKIDPHNIGIINQQMSLMGDRARAVTEKLALMRQTVQQMSPHTINRLSAATEDAALNAKHAEAEYAKVCEQIRVLKNRVSDAAGVSRNVWKGIEGTENVMKKLRSLGASVQTVTQYLDLARQHGLRLQELNFAKQAADFKKLGTDIATCEVEARELYMQMARLVTQNPSATMTAGFRKLRSEMDHMEVAAKELASDMQKLEQALKLDPSNMDAARLKMAAMQEQTRLNIEEMKNLNKQLDALRASGADKVAADIGDLKQETMKAENRVASLNMELDETRKLMAIAFRSDNVDEATAELNKLAARAAELRTQLALAKKQLDGLGNANAYVAAKTHLASLSAQTNKLVADMRQANTQAMLLKGSLQQLGWATYSTLTPAFSMFAYTAISAAEEVDAAYRDMRKTVQGTEEQFEELKQAALDYSRTHVTDAATLLSIEAMGGQLGVATDKLGEFATVVSNLEIATNLNADTASEQLGQLSAILNDMTQDDFAEFGDALVRLGNNNATLEDKIMDVMLRIASMGTITGFTTTELLSWSTAVAATGQGAEAAGTAISKTMSDIEAAVGKGGDSLAGFASIAGMTSSEFAQAWNETPSDALKAFIEGLRGIEQSGGSADAALEGLKITSVRQKQAILGLMQTIGGLNDNLTMSENAWNGISDEWGAAGDAAREAAAKSEGFSGAIKQLRNNFKVLGVEMGESLTPAILALTDFVSAATQAYSDLGEVGKTAVNMGVMLGAGLGPAVVFMNAFGGAFKDMVKSLATKGSAWAATVKNNKQVTDSLGAAAVAAANGTDANLKLAKSFDEMSRREKVAYTGLGMLKGALAGLGVTAAIAGIMGLVGVMKDAYEKTVDLRDATTGLNQAVSGWSGYAATQGLDAYADFAYGAAMSVDELIKKQAELARTIDERHKATETDAALLSRWGDTIEELAGKSDITDEELAKLKIAVEEVNAACEKNYTVEQEGDAYYLMADGAKVATDAIYDLIEAKKAEIRADAYAETYKELVAQDLENARTLTEAQIRYDEARQNFIEAQNAGLNTDQYESFMDQAEVDLEKAQAAYDANHSSMEAAEEQYALLTAATEENTSAMEKWLASQDVARNALSLGGKSLFGFASALTELGLSQDQLANRTPEQWHALATAYDGTVTSIALLLDEWGIAIDEAAIANAEAAQKMSEDMDMMHTDVVDAFEKMAEDTGVSKDTFINQLVDAGVSVEDFQSLTAAQLAYIVQHYDGNINEAIKLLDLFVLENGSKGEEAPRVFAQGIEKNADLGVAATGKMVDDSLAEFGDPSMDTEPYGEDFAEGFAQGIKNGEQTYVWDAVQDMVNNAINLVPKTQQSSSPSKITMGFGEDFTEGYAVGIENSADMATDAAESLVDDTLDMLATSESGAWTYGYHAAVNYAEGLASGSGAVKEAAGSLAESAEDEMEAFIANLAAQYKQAQLVAKEGSKLLTDIMWGSIYPATLDYEFAKPVTEDVYASMKTLEAAGYDLDSYMKKYDEYQEKYEEWQVKRKRGEVNTDSEKNSYADFKEEYDAFMKMADSVSDIDRLQEWHGLYTVKDDLITGIDAATDWSDSLVSLFNKTGVVYSENFVEAMVNGGEEYQSALRKMAGMTADQVQEMVDSFDDLALAEREQEINARSLWVNSMPEYVKSSKEMMLDFREVCLDVKEAMYSDSGLAKAFAYTGTEVVNLALDLQSLEVDMATFAANANSYAMQVADGFNAMTTYNQTGLAEWERNLKANIVSSNQWKDDINEVFSKVDPAIDSEAFRQAVYSEGFETWGQVMADMANMTSEQITGYIELYNEAIATGLVNATETFDDLAPGDELMEAAIAAMDDSIPLLEQTALEAGKAGAASALTTLPEWVTTGQNLAGGIASGIQSRVGSIAAAAAAAVRAAIAAAKAEAEIASPSKVMRDEVGYMLGMGMAVGMDRSQAKVALASTLAVETAVNAAKRSIALNGVSAQVAAANGFAAARAASVTNNSTTNDNRSYSSPVTVSIQATIREDADITKLAKEINKVQQRALRAGGNA